MTRFYWNARIGSWRLWGLHIGAFYIGVSLEAKE